MMYYVNPSEVMRLFVAYLDDEQYDKGLISKESAIEELKDALESAECQWIEAEGVEE